MMYLDRKNLPPSFGELMKQEREEGKEEGQRLVAQELLKEGMPVEKVAKYAKLPMEEVEKLKGK